jgi:hypothetical protein
MRLVFFLVSQSKKSYHAHHPHKCFQEQTPPSLVGRIIDPDSPAHTHRLPFLPLSLSRQCRAPALAYLLALRITPPLHSFSIPFLSPAIYLFHRLLSLLYINTTTVTTKIICSASSSRRDHPAQLTGLPTARLIVS